MSAAMRKNTFLIFAVVLAALLVWGVYDLPGFGKYPGPYGDILLKTTVPERQTTDVVTAVMFDQRGFDTLGEEFILFAAVVGVVLLLRETPEGEQRPVKGKEEKTTERSDAIALLCLLVAPIVLVFGIYVAIHGHITVGGGFQGGIIIASAWLLVYLAAERRLFSKLAPKEHVEIFESFGAAAYAIIGFFGMFTGAAYLQNVLPLGKATELLSGGTIPLINFFVGVEVSAAFLLLMIEFLHEAREAERSGSR